MGRTSMRHLAPNVPKVNVAKVRSPDTKCNHGVRRRACRTCNPMGFLRARVDTLISAAFVGEKSNYTEILGCTIPHYHAYLTSKLQEGMTWENYGRGDGKWCIDHITPIRYGYWGRDKPQPIEEVKQRLHYLNTQPMWFEENSSKLNSFIGRE